MPVQGVIQSPVLVGRDAFLTLLEGRLADAAAGAGRVLPSTAANVLAIPRRATLKTAVL